MNRTLRTLWGTLSSRALPPLILGFFLTLYIGIAFFTDETLISLMTLTRRIPLLAALLALLPLNAGCRMILESSRYLARRRALSGAAIVVNSDLFDESVHLAAPALFGQLEARLRTEGYATVNNGNRLAAWRGLSLFPARLLYLAGMFCLFGGILISLVSRSVERQAVVQGAPFPAPEGNGGIVREITFRNSAGPILARELVLEVAGPDGRGGVDRFGIYPPARFQGAFVYPRYLGVALQYRFFAPDLPGGYEKSAVLPLYPPGREASAEISGTPYRLTLALAKPEDGSDPYMTGKMHFLFTLLKGKELLQAGSLPEGGEFSRDGYKLTIPAFRRMVMTDFVKDDGVLLIWGAGFLFMAGLLLRLPVRLFFPRREMLFCPHGEMVSACSRAEGKQRAHAGVFHEALDLLETTKM
jgi:hypothetical protein